MLKFLEFDWLIQNKNLFWNKVHKFPENGNVHQGVFAEFFYQIYFSAKFCQKMPEIGEIA